MCPHTFDTALCAVGAVVRATHLVLDSLVHNKFFAVRSRAHHALPAGANTPTAITHNQLALIGILRCLSFATADFGMLTVNTPFFISADIFVPSTDSGTRTVRENDP